MFCAVFWLGRKAAKRMQLDDRGDWDHPLPQRFPLNQVVAVYKRRKKYHYHDRHYHLHRHSRRHS